MTLSCHLRAGFGRSVWGCFARRRFIRGVGVFSFALSSLLLGAGAPLRAADTTVANGITLSDLNFTMANGDTLAVLFGGTIEDSNNEAVTATGNVTIDNAGTLTSTAGNEDGIEHTAGMLTLFNRATGTITGVDRNGVQADVLTLINLGSITGGDNEGVSANSITSLINSGTITGAGSGVDTISLTSLINSGTITGGGNGVDVSGTITSLINTGTINGTNNRGVDATTITSLTNSGTINGGDEGVFATTITGLINSGTITGGAGEDAVRATTITSLINTGTINGGDEAVEVTGELISLINSGTITGANDGIFVVKLTSLINSGTITGNDDAVEVTGELVSLINSGTITGGNDGIFAVTITSLINSGTINGGAGAGADAVEATNLLSLTNSGKITGGDHAIIETGAANTLLTLLPGSDIFGAIDLGGGVNTLVVGNGLSIDHLFTGILPQVINSNGAPLFIIGNRVVVVDTSSTLDQQDEQLFDLSQGIWGTVFNNIGDGRNPAAAFANGTLPQYSLGAVPPGEIAGGYTTTHMWASVFGNHRIEDGGSNVRHNLAGLITGLDSRLNSNVRLGAFFGASETDIDSVGNQDNEVENIFGGLYASFKTDGLTIDLGVTGGASEYDSTRVVDNNQVNGLQNASSSFDGTFIAPELSISSQYDMGGAILQPTLRVGYAGLFLDGYTETGTATLLTVGDRDLHMLHARFELAALIISSGDDSLSFSFSPYVGVEGRSIIDGESVNVTLLGQNLNFNTGGDDDIASAFAGMRLSVLQTENFGIFAGVEGSFDTDESSIITGNLGLKWMF